VVADFVLTNNDAQTTDITLTKPDNVAVGDLLVLLVNCDPDILTTWDTPIGWTFLAQAGTATVDNYPAVFWRVADGTEGDTVDVTNSGGSLEHLGWYLRITGADVTDPIDVFSTSQNTAPSASFYTTPTVITTVDNALVLSFVGFDGSDGAEWSQSEPGWPQTFPAGREAKNPVTPSSYGLWSGWLTKKMPTAGDAGNVTYNVTGPGDGWAHVAFAIRPLV
jgi:hypothetical protein